MDRDVLDTNEHIEDEESSLRPASFDERDSYYFASLKAMLGLEFIWKESCRERASYIRLCARCSGCALDVPAQQVLRIRLQAGKRPHIGCARADLIAHIIRQHVKVLPRLRIVFEQRVHIRIALFH